MQRKSTFFSGSVIASVFFLLVGIGTSAYAQKKITIQATARGTSTQLGRVLPVKIIINQLSSPEDRNVLIEAFERSGNQGMLDALTRMTQKGRFSLEGRVGNDVKYIWELPSSDGRRLRLLTDRNLAFAEIRESTRSSEYSIGAVELTLTPDGKGSGTLLPACKLKVNKQKQLEVEAYQNPWQLTNFIVTYGD